MKILPIVLHMGHIPVVTFFGPVLIIFWVFLRPIVSKPIFQFIKSVLLTGCILYKTGKQEPANLLYKSQFNYSAQKWGNPALRVEDRILYLGVLDFPTILLKKSI